MKRSKRFPGKLGVLFRTATASHRMFLLKVLLPGAVLLGGVCLETGCSVPQEKLQETGGSAPQEKLQETGGSAPQAGLWETEEDTLLPSAYDGRKEGRVPIVKNQGTFGTCWAFASLQALEARLLPGEVYDFSEDHMSLNNGFRRSKEEGGEYTMSMAYLLSWKGPVLEAEDPYGDGISPDGLEPEKHVQEIQIIPGKDYDKIKRAVLLYGGAQSSLYISMTDGNSRSEAYNKDASAYCYIGSQPPNHDSVIIGWDDDYPKENFKAQVNGNGAFICMNSWGDDFGDQGFFYVSYYDSNIGMNNLVYTKVEKADNYSHIYQSDLRGWAGQLGYDSETVWFSNVYEAGSREQLKAAGFYATGISTDYEVYVARYVGNETEILGKTAGIEGEPAEPAGGLGHRALAAQGSLVYSGFYTIPFTEISEEDLCLEPGERFAVIVRLTTPGTVHPAAVEFDSGDGRTFADISDGEGYISSDGSAWERVEEKQSCNLCLKAYTNDR